MTASSRSVADASARIPTAVAARTPPPSQRELWRWLASLALVSPVIAFYIGAHAYPILRRGLSPTGFIQTDMPSYLANAREAFDAGTAPLYPNPYSVADDPPPLYFQPHIALLGALGRATGCDPGLLFVAFGLVCAIACARISIALFERVAGGIDTVAERLGLVAFVWGGGVFVVAGAAAAAMPGVPPLPWQDVLLRFDPADGWWLLNPGRNLVYPTEAYYHALVFATLLAIVSGCHGIALGLAFVLSASHPFSGTELLLVLVAWGIAERVARGESGVGRWFLPAAGALAALHFGYYLVFLPRFAEHAIVMRQWTLDWSYGASAIVPALALVGAVAVGNRRRIDLARPENRLFLAMFAVTFALSNHDLVVARPFQPLHFDRGYVWASLFLLGARALVALLDRLLALDRRAIGRTAAVALFCLFLADNAVWFGGHTVGGLVTGSSRGFALRQEDRALFVWLNSLDGPPAMVVAEDPNIAYLVPTYTRHRSWATHKYNEPDFESRRAEVDAFFRSRAIHPVWRARGALYIVDRRDARSDDGIPGRRVFANGAHAVYRFDPRR